MRLDTILRHADVNHRRADATDWNDATLENPRFRPATSGAPPNLDVDVRVKNRGVMVYSVPLTEDRAELATFLRAYGDDAAAAAVERGEAPDLDLGVTQPGKRQPRIQVQIVEGRVTALRRGDSR